jgi:hypothetical protein
MHFASPWVLRLAIDTVARSVLVHWVLHCRAQSSDSIQRIVRVSRRTRRSRCPQPPNVCHAIPHQLQIVLKNFVFDARWPILGRRNFDVEAAPREKIWVRKESKSRQPKLSNIHSRRPAELSPPTQFRFPCRVHTNFGWRFDGVPFH